MSTLTSRLLSPAIARCLPSAKQSHRQKAREPTEQSIQRSPSRPAQSIEQVRGWRLELQGQDILHGICVHGICICHCCLVAKSCPTLLQPHGVCQAPLSMGSPRQEYWSGLPFPSPGDHPDPGIESASPALAGAFFPTEPPGKPCLHVASVVTAHGLSSCSSLS